MILQWHKIVEYVEGATLREWDGISEKFLQITRDTALSIPCPKRPEYCNMVIRHKGEDNYRGVCEQRPHGCDSMKFNKSEIALYDFNVTSFLDLLSAHLNINERKLENFSEFFNLWRLGKLTPHSQHHFQVFFLLEASPEKLLNAFNHINMSLGIEHYVIIVPSKNIIKLPAEQYCARKKIRIYSLEEIFSTKNSLNIMLEEYVNEDIRRWMNNFIFKGDKNNICYFPEVPDISWEDLTLSLVGLYEIYITSKNGRSHGCYSYIQMGMIDSRKRGDDDYPKSSEAWGTLIKFVGGNREMETNDNDEAKRGLANALKKFFGCNNKELKKDPFITKRNVSYRTKFNLRYKL